MDRQIEMYQLIDTHNNLGSHEADSFMAMNPDPARWSIADMTTIYDFFVADMAHLADIRGKMRSIRNKPSRPLPAPSDTQIPSDAMDSLIRPTISPFRSAITTDKANDILSWKPQ